MHVTAEGEEYCCAKCRHWMLGTLDYQARMNALASGTVCTCHVHQNGFGVEGIGKTRSSDFCQYYEEPVFRNRPPIQTEVKA